MQLHQARRLSEGEAIYLRIVGVDPSNLFAVHLLGVVRMQSGRLQEAIPSLEHAVATANPPVEWFVPLVSSTAALGWFDRAIEWQLKALSIRPNWADGYFRLAELLAADARYENAVDALNKSITLGCSSPAIAFNNLGVTLDRLKRFADAVPAYLRALKLKPDYAVAHRNLGDALRQLNDYAAAETSYRNAVRCDASLADAYNGIGLTLYLRDRFADAAAQFQTALRLDPADTNPCINLVLCYGRLGDHEQIESTLRQAMALNPTDSKVHSTLTMLMNYTRGHLPPAVLNESLEFNRLHAAAVFPTHPILKRHRAAGVPMRIGYISPDFRSHPVAIFFEPLLERHDRTQFTIVCYADVSRPDAVTDRFKSSADLWRDTTGQSDAEVAEQIRQDEIDILIDLAGHTSDNRLLVLARKPAPVQATWLGYPNTTGLAAVDYRITDAWADPPGVEPYYTEKLVRLPDAFFVYRPPELEIPVSPLPMIDSGRVTFGSFNNVTKITPAIGKLWSDILKATPGARLLIAGVPPDAQKRIIATIVCHEVSMDRIEFPQTTGFEAFLKLHDRVDVGLDAFPYAGHTTTCNCLWMGVPVVTLAGPSAVSRVGVSITANLGMADQWVAASEPEYVRLATEWARRPDDLAMLRAELRSKLLASVLTDEARFARNFEDAVRLMVAS